MPTRQGSRKTGQHSSKKYRANPKRRKTPDSKGTSRKTTPNASRKTTPKTSRKTTPKTSRKTTPKKTKEVEPPPKTDKNNVNKNKQEKVEEANQPKNEEKNQKNEQQQQQPPEKQDSQPSTPVQKFEMKEENFEKEEEKKEQPKVYESNEKPIKEEENIKENIKENKEENIKETKEETKKEEEKQAIEEDEVEESLEILGSSDPTTPLQAERKAQKLEQEENTPTTPVQNITHSKKYKPLKVEEKPWTHIAESSDDATHSKSSPLVHTDLHIPISDHDNLHSTDVPSPMSLHKADDLPGAVNEKTPITKFSTNSSEEINHFRKSSSLAHIVHGMDQKKKLQRKSTIANMNHQSSSSSFFKSMNCFKHQKSVPISIMITILAAILLVCFSINQLSLYFIHFGSILYRNQFVPKNEYMLTSMKMTLESRLAPLSMNAYSIKTLLADTTNFDTSIQLIEKFEKNIAIANAQKRSTTTENRNIYNKGVNDYNLNALESTQWSVNTNFTILYFQNETTAYGWYREGNTLINETIQIANSPYAHLNRSSQGWFLTNSTQADKFYGQMLPLENGRAVYIGTPMSLLTISPYYSNDKSLFVEREEGLIVCGTEKDVIGRSFQDAKNYGSSGFRNWINGFQPESTSSVTDGIVLINGITPGYITYMYRLESPSIDIFILVTPRTNFAYHILSAIVITLSLCFLIALSTLAIIIVHRYLLNPIHHLTEIVSVLQLESYSKSAFDACFDSLGGATFRDVDELRYHLLNLLYKLEIFIPYVPQDIVDEQESLDTSSSTLSEAESIIHSDFEDPTGDSDEEKWIVEHTDEDGDNTMTQSTPTPSTTRTEDKLHPEIFNSKNKRRIHTPRMPNRRDSKNPHSNSIIKHKSKLRFGHSTVMVVWLHNIEKLLSDGLSLYDFSQYYEAFFRTVRNTSRTHRGTLDNFSESIVVFTFRRVHNAIDAAIAMDLELQSLPKLDKAIEYTIGVSSGREWHGLIGDESMKKRHSFGRVSRRAKHLATSLYDSWRARVVVCENSARQIENDYKVAPITYVEKYEMGRTLAFQLAGKYDLWDGEWMYQLRIQQEKRDFKVFNDAFQHYMIGHTDKALELFNKFAKSDSHDTVHNLIAQFIDLCNRDTANPNPQIVTISATPTNYAHQKQRFRMRSNSVSNTSMSSDSHSLTPTSPGIFKSVDV